VRKLGSNSYALEGSLVWTLIARGIYDISICEACNHPFAYNNARRKRRSCCKRCSSQIHARKKLYANTTTTLDSNSGLVPEISQGA
jgi:hypothetical protein